MDYHFYIKIALAETIKQERALINTECSYWYFLKQIMTTKRKKMYELAEEAGLNPVMPQGGYFMMMDLSSLSNYISYLQFSFPLFF